MLSMDGEGMVMGMGHTRRIKEYVLFFFFFFFKSVRKSSKVRIYPSVGKRKYASFHLGKVCLLGLCCRFNNYPNVAFNVRHNKGEIADSALPTLALPKPPG
jgi:hypothetical protein